MNSLICTACVDKNRPYRPMGVEYIDRRSSTRQRLFSCSVCDHAASWPVFNAASTPKPEKTP